MCYLKVNEMFYCKVDKIVDPINCVIKNEFKKLNF